VIRFGLIAIGMALSACAQPEPVSVLPVKPVDPVITPVEIRELPAPTASVPLQTNPLPQPVAVVPAQPVTVVPAQPVGAPPRLLDVLPIRPIAPGTPPTTFNAVPQQPVPAFAQPSPLSQPIIAPPVPPSNLAVTPVEFSQLRGQSVMVLDRTDPQFAVQRITTYLRQCKTGAGERIVFEPNGLRLVDTSGLARLTVMIAQRGPVTGVALGGPDYTPFYQEELAQAIEGRSTCA